MLLLFLQFAHRILTINNFQGFIKFPVRGLVVGGFCRVKPLIRITVVKLSRGIFSSFAPFNERTTFLTKFLFAEVGDMAHL